MGSYAYSVVNVQHYLCVRENILSQLSNRNKLRQWKLPIFIVLSFLIFIQRFTKWQMKRVEPHWFETSVDWIVDTCRIKLIYVLFFFLTFVFEVNGVLRFRVALSETREN